MYAHISTSEHKLLQKKKNSIQKLKQFRPEDSVHLTGFCEHNYRTQTFGQNCYVYTVH